MEALVRYVFVPPSSNIAFNLALVFVIVERADVVAWIKGGEIHIPHVLPRKGRIPM